MHRLVCALLLASLPPAASAAEGHKLLGAQLSVGVPQGLALAAAVRPLPWLRAHGGLGYGFGPGVQGGVTFLPWQGVVAPTLTLEAGHFFETDVSDDFEGEFPDAFDPSLRKFGYDFYSAQLGVELGSQRGLAFFLRAGLAWLRSGLDGVDGYVDPGTPDTTIDVSEVKLRATVPTVNLGLLWHFW
jgi:hypothetical protein